jgi:hypothetical protein
MMILPVKGKPDTIHVTQSLTGDTITIHGHVTGPNYLHITREQAKHYWPIIKAWGEGCPLRQLGGQATTSHVERMNLSARTFMRRFTRCALGFSKKLDNLKHAVALFGMAFQLCACSLGSWTHAGAGMRLGSKPFTIAELLGGL